MKAIKNVKAGPDFYKRVGNRLLNDFRMGFKLSRAPDGSSWKPLSHRPGKPLVLTGRLRSSLTMKMVGNSAVEVGTNVKYAKRHQFGGTMTVTVPAHTKLVNKAWGKKLKYPVWANVKSHKKTVNIHPRPFMGIEAPQKQMIYNIYMAYLKQQTGNK
ncbi:phage virion morphogenesis protein [Salinimonas marina]|uniref:Phage virion morphogenesis protein n=1 Tax=Salinimonas marina TaxID=2785918 RepID=A0A7S9DZK4_9ALTE|nr:phage virion morphogenesis protein [Salinimonas marina]QPG06558.1 phage virion morphogenesis protein [Salinimonas marina]